MAFLRWLFVVAVSCTGALASAAQIDLRLDIDYAGGSPAGGGVWSLYARTDLQGLFSLRAPIDGVSSAITNDLPRGRVNGSAIDNAGFSIFANQPASGGGRDLFLAQQVLPPSAPQQGAFYGVGTLSNGSPLYPGRPGGTTALGPNLTTLTAVQNVPWGASDPVWSNGVEVASGTFSAGSRPDFGTGPLEGFLFSTVGNLTTPGATLAADTITTLVRTNLVFGVATGDYNGNGVVDAADYTRWRDTSGQQVTALTGADGSGDGFVNATDYAVWQSNFGASAAADAAAVPEPSTACLVTALLAIAGRDSREKPGANRYRRSAA